MRQKPRKCPFSDPHFGYRHLKGPHSTLHEQRPSTPEHTEPINLWACQESNAICWWELPCATALGECFEGTTRFYDPRAVIIPERLRNAAPGPLHAQLRWSWDLNPHWQKLSHVREALFTSQWPQHESIYTSVFWMGTKLILLPS